MGKKFNQALLNEELKKFKLISEYTFYTEEPKRDDGLLLGSELDEAGEEPIDPNADPNAAPEAAPEDDSQTAAAAPATDPGQAPVDPNAAPEAAPEDDPNNTFGGDDMGGEEDPDMNADEVGGGDDVEIDVTQLVQGSEEATHAANDASHKASEILNKFSDLERKVASMNGITQKIDALEKEIVKRNPTPLEKLDMQSLKSYPFNVKLTDYWSDVPGYDATEHSKPKEYILRKDDVDSGFSDGSIKNSFNDYDEEDI